MHVIPRHFYSSIDQLRSLKPRRCEWCGIQYGDLRRCGACQVVYYCQPACQLADSVHHAEPCNTIFNARCAYTRECRKVPPDLAAIEYSLMAVHRARVGGYGKPGGSAEVVQTALKDLQDMLRRVSFNEVRSLGLCCMLPGLLIRLGRDDEALQYIKFNNCLYRRLYDPVDFQNMVPAELDDDGNLVESADDDPSECTHNCGLHDEIDLFHQRAESLLQGGRLLLSHAPFILLLKMRALLVLKTLQNAQLAFFGILPQEIIDLIKARVLDSVTCNRQDMLVATPETMQQLDGELERDVQVTCQYIQTCSSKFWDIFTTDTDAKFLSDPSSYELGQPWEEYSRLVVGSIYAA
ncbi:hypothetical protein XA68_13480 [Ophiocordyceps unilateralis]|uniref:MYND-type domain-containing protein n=1 Tax=Ophiocordyceps unilateralis TaxID=268505 RepID=A0A2A9PBA3_OPHUN|nr:hypothetical protein XA68_13480 [Ophiocordyceps unilateralis]